MAFECLIRREIVFATRGTAESVSDLVLESQVVDKRSLLFEDLVAKLTQELQTKTIKIQKIQVAHVELHVSTRLN